jgi:hypothetical protein
MKYDHFSLLPENAFQPRNGRFGMTLEGGSGGGGGGPQEQYISTAPKEFLPYIERSLGKAEALTETPYQTYGGERFAGPTAEQQAARAEMYGMQTPGQFGTATSVAERSLALGTDPYAAQKYMSPYMQSVVDVQKQAATREAQLAQQQANLAGARRPGAFGSAAQAIGQAERERNLMSRLGEIQATGSQKAFENAQQMQQFGSQLGLQGAQTLGQLGTARQGADLSRLQAQEQFGALGQKEQQQMLDLAYQDFMAQQRNPYQQLEFMRTMVSGQPLGQAQQMYQAPQSQMQNLMQLGLGGLGIYGAYGGFR